MSYDVSVTPQEIDRYSETMSAELRDNFFRDPEAFNAFFVVPGDFELALGGEQGESAKDLTYQEACLVVHEIALSRFLGGLGVEQIDDTEPAVFAVPDGPRLALEVLVDAGHLRQLELRTLADN